MNTERLLKRMNADLIPIIFVIHMISFVRISVVIFISFMNLHRVQRKWYILENFLRIFSRIVIENLMYFSEVQIFVYIVGKL